MWPLLINALGSMARSGGSNGQPSQSDNGMDLSGLMRELFGAGKQPGQALQQQQNTASDALLPPKSFGQGVTEQDGLVPYPDGSYGDYGDVPSGAMQDPQSMNVAPQKQFVSGNAQDISGGLNYAQQAANGHVGPHNASDRPTADMLSGSNQIGNAGGNDWSSLFNVTGNMTNPNMFTKMGVGYNQGGLMGALGYLLTDMNQGQGQ